MRSTLSPKQQETIEGLSLAGKTTREIATHLRIAYHLVWYHQSKTGLRKPRRYASREKVAQAVRLVRNYGAPVRAVAAHVKLPPKVVASAVRRHEARAH